MKKVLMAALCCGMFTLGSVDSVEASEQQIANIEQSTIAEIQKLGWWSHFRDKHIYGKDPYRHDKDRDRVQPPPLPPPPRYNYGPGPRGHYPPPPPPRRPPGPPPRHHSVQDVDTTQLVADKAVE